MQQSYRDDRPPHYQRMKVRTAPHTCSWKRYDDGVMYAEIDLHTSGVLQVDICETPQGGRGGKRVIVSFETETARGIYEMLRTVFEQESKQ